jgi:hypothetical protein
VKSSLKKIYSASRHSFTARGVSITSESYQSHSRLRGCPHDRRPVAHSFTDESGCSRNRAPHGDDKATLIPYRVTLTQRVVHPITTESGCCHGQGLEPVAAQSQRVGHQPRTDSSGFYAYSCRTIRPVHLTSTARSNPCFARCSLRATFIRNSN